MLKKIIFFCEKACLMNFLDKYNFIFQYKNYKKNYKKVKL